MAEETERVWFVRVVTIIMLACIAVGTVPIVKNMIYPPQARR